MNANVLAGATERTPVSVVHSALQHFPDSLDLVEGSQLIAFAAFPHPPTEKRRKVSKAHPYAVAAAVTVGALAVTALVNRHLARKAEHDNPSTGQFP